MKKLAMVVALIALAGCAQVQQQRELQKRDFTQTIPGCFSDKECEVKWAAARRFVLEHSTRKIQTLTNDYLETYNPPANDPGLAWRVSKEPVQGNGYRIIAAAWCNNIFGCVPNDLATMIQFNFAVNNAWTPQ